MDTFSFDHFTHRQLVDVNWGVQTNFKTVFFLLVSPYFYGTEILPNET